MAIPANYLNELNKSVNNPHIIVELEADSGPLKYGFNAGGFSDVLPCLKNVSSLQNKLDPAKAIGTRGQASLTIAGRDNFKALVRDEYLKNRRVVFKSGFVAEGYAYSDYVEFFTGLISNWSRKGDELTITVADDLAVKATIKLPDPDDANPLSTVINYQDLNPVDIILDIVKVQLGVAAARVDTANMEAERDDWIPGLKFDRVLVEPKSANKYLNELQVEAGCFLFHTGQKVDLKIFAPMRPGVTVDTLTDDWHIISDSLTQSSGYTNNFYNRIVVYSDYDESGGDDAANFEYAVIAADPTSQSSSNWNEVKTKEIKCKWVRSRTYAQPSAISGVTIYHMSRANAVGVGTLKWTDTTNTLQWTAPGGTIGEAVEVSEDGQFQLFDANNQASIRIAVDFSVLVLESTQSESIAITSLAGDTYADTLANRAVIRFRNPVASVKWNVDINEINSGTAFRKPGDFINLTTDEAFEFGSDTWTAVGLMLTSVRSDFTKRLIAMEAIETKLAGSGYGSKTGFIGDGATMASDYDSATDDDKNYAYIALDGTPPTVGTAADPAYVTW
jgi:hypothetical protein